MEKHQDLPDLQDFDFQCDLQVRFSDIDGYNHVNNGVYFSYFEHARALFLHEVCQWDIMAVGTVVAKTTISFLKPVHIQDSIACRVRCVHLGNTSFELEQILFNKQRPEEVLSTCATLMVSVDMQTMRPTAIPDSYRLKLQPKG
ncbi:acyl-CoA thioesterase [Algoriphagus namhaensis]